MAYLVTPYARISYPRVFEPVADDNGKLKYSATLVFYPAEQKTPEFAALRADLKRVLQEKFPNGKIPGSFRADPFLDGEEKGHEAGTVVLRVSSIRKPGIVDQQRRPVVEADRIYPGCWVRATVNCYVYDNPKNKGATFGLGNIQFVKDDEPFAGARRAEDDFGVLEADTGVDLPF